MLCLRWFARRFAHFGMRTQFNTTLWYVYLCTGYIIYWKIEVNEILKMNEVDGLLLASQLKLPLLITWFSLIWVLSRLIGMCSNLTRSTLIGLTLFALGAFVNVQSDSILRNLRRPGERGYKIPRGGLFEYVSGANYLGECVEWIGYALCARTLPSFAFAIFTLCNIGPRAVHHHRQVFFEYILPNGLCASLQWGHLISLFLLRVIRGLLLQVFWESRHIGRIRC